MLCLLATKNQVVDNARFIAEIGIQSPRHDRRITQDLGEEGLWIQLPAEVSTGVYAARTCECGLILS